MSKELKHAECWACLEIEFKCVGDRLRRRGIQPNLEMGFERDSDTGEREGLST